MSLCRTISTQSRCSALPDFGTAALSFAPNPVMRPRLQADSQDSFELLMDLNRAHVVMLAAQGIVQKDNASKLMQVFEEVRAAGAGEITWDPELEEVYYSTSDFLRITSGIG